MGSSSSSFAEGALLALLVAIAGCGDDDGPAMVDGGDETYIALVDPALAFEGQTLVASLVIDGVASSATAISAAPGSPLEIVEQNCSGARCAVVIHVRDLAANTGRGVPATIDAMNASVFVRDDAGHTHVGNLGVLPLDAIDESQREVMLSGMRFASAVSLSGDATLHVGPAAGQLVVFGEAVLEGVIDASATGSTPSGGGAAGGTAGAAGEGPGGAERGAGAGHRDEGDRGSGEAGGASYGDETIACAFALEPGICGGSGGGGAAGEGGGGGGAFSLLALGPLRGAIRVAARGGDGQGGAGGGSGGAIAIGATNVDGEFDLDVSGGEGDSSGGRGAPGWIRVDGVGVEGAFAGPVFDPIPAVSREPVITVTGHAAPNAAIEIQILSTGATFEAQSDGSGAFAVDVVLEVGLDRLALTATSDGVAARSLAGNGVELETLAPGQTRVVGATLDLVYVP